MKYYIVSFLLFTIFVFGQNNTNSQSTPNEKPLIYISNNLERENYLKKIKHQVQKNPDILTRNQNLLPVYLCSNGTFEEFETIGTKNYLKYFNYTYTGISNPSQCASVNVSATTGIEQYNPSINNAMATTVPSNFIDEYIGNINAFDQYALKTNFKDSPEILSVVQSKRMKTDNEQVLRFNYKTVLQNIHSDSGHENNQPFFKARILNKNGVSVSEFCLIGDQNNCIFTKAPYLEGGEIVLYTKNWQTGILDISSIPNNEEFTIEFTTARCGLMGHFGYTYIDDLCIIHSDENIQGSIELDPLYKICPALPISVCGNYTVPNSGGVTATVSSITLNVFEGTNTTPVYTTTTTSSHDTVNKRFCFNIAAENLPNITTGNYNVGVKINYAISQTNCSGTSFASASDNDANPGWDISFLNCTNCDISMQPGSISQCDNDKNGKEFFDLSIANTQVAGTQNGLTFSYFKNITDAANNTAPITNYTRYETSSSAIFIRVSKSATCYKIIAVNLIVKNPSATISGILNVCSGSTDLTASPGESYVWSTGDLTRKVTVNSTGTYSVNVTDASGCIATASVTILANQMAVQPTIETIQPNCFVTKGTITITSPASLISFDGGITWGTDLTKSNLNVDNYSIKIQTASGCTSYATNVTIHPFYMPFPNYSTVQPTSCGGTGSIKIITVASSYSFDDGVTWGTSNSLDNLPSGTYKIRTKNEFGCISNFNSVVLTGEFLENPTYTVIPPVCDIGGSITITTPATEYSFDGGTTWGTSNVLNDIVSGNYMVIIKNNLGCTSSNMYVYINDFKTSYPQYTTVQPACGTGGSITITTISDQYSFDGGATWTTDPTSINLASGTYRIQMKNNLGCISNTSYVYLYDFYLPYPDYTVIQPSCGNGGTVTITTPADQYSFDNGVTWTNNATSPSLAPGSMVQIKIKNALGCLSYSSYIYLYEVFLDSPTYVIVQPTCEAKGSITITTTATEYSFDDGVTWGTTNLLDNLSAGYYRIKIKNGAGCTSQSNYAYLYEPYLPTPSYSIVHPFCRETTGIITIDPVSDYSYSFDGGTTYQTSNISPSLPYGPYVIKTKNTIGCESSSQYVYINSPSGIPPAPAGNTNQLFCVFNNPTVKFLVAQGENIKWYSSLTSIIPLDLSTPLIDGMTYFATQTGSNTCESQDRLRVNVAVISYDIPVKNYETLVCDNLNNGNENVNLNDYNSEIIIDPENHTFSFYTSFLGAEEAISTAKINNNTSHNLTIGEKIIFVRVVAANGCYRVAELKLTLIPSPYNDMKPIAILCENKSVDLTAKPGFYTYKWSSGQITQSIRVYSPGNYSVTVTEKHGDIICSTITNMTVVLSNPATISEIKTIDWSANENTITVIVTNSSVGDYEYSLDGSNYQNSNTFTNLDNGTYKIYIRDKNRCGITVDDFYLLTHPKFFTPNNDGINDYWKIKFSTYEPGLAIKIFDRYGKFIKQLSHNDAGWDGTLNGIPLPSTDYWFVVTRANGREHRGHFSLKR